MGTGYRRGCVLPSSHYFLSRFVSSVLYLSLIPQPLSGGGLRHTPTPFFSHPFRLFVCSFVRFFYIVLFTHFLFGNPRQGMVWCSGMVYKGVVSSRPIFIALGKPEVSFFLSLRVRGFGI